MNIEAVENTSNNLNTGETCVDTDKRLDEAVTTYQNPGPHSGIMRLAQEEQLQVSTNRNLRIISLKEKSAEVETRILNQPYTFQHDEGYLRMIAKIAPMDPQFAKTLVAKINSEERKIFGYIEVSKHQDTEGARATLEEAKDVVKRWFWIYPKAGLQLYEEQKRRGFLEAYQTAQMLHKYIEKHIDPSCENLYSFLNLAMVELSLEKFEIVSTLSMAFNLAKRKVNTEDPVLFPYSLERLGEYAARAQLPIARDVIRLFKETIHRIEKGDYGQTKHKEYWPESTKLTVWEQLINMEARCPFLESEYYEDVKTYIQVILECAKNHPEEKFYYDSMFLKLVKTLAPSHAEFAKTLIPFIQSHTTQFNGRIEIFQEEAKLEGYDKTKGFAELEISYKNSFAGNCSLSVQLFCAAAEHMGMDRATQFINRAKYLMDQAYSEDNKFLLCREILQAEVKYSLESRRDTLKTLYQIGKSPGINLDLPWVLEMIIDAELSLI